MISFVGITFYLFINCSQAKTLYRYQSQQKQNYYSGTYPDLTYHKYFKELQERGIIVYRSSYHPGVKSEVDIKKTPYQ